MSLEDTFLRALYANETTVTSDVLAQELGISENALCSIINRIKKSYPHFVREEQGSPPYKCTLCPNKMAESEVQLFLAGGGFAIINERELKEYEEMLKQMEAHENEPQAESHPDRPRKKAITWAVVTAGVVTLSLNYIRKLTQRNNSKG